MKLFVVYIPNPEKGITLLEVMLVIAIFVFLIGISSPLVIDFYKSRQFDTHFSNVVQALRRAQLNSMTGRLDSLFGVYLQPSSYTLFKGQSYSERDVAFDEVFELPANISISGISEVVFSKIRGIPSETGDVMISYERKSGTININEIGLINY